MNTYWTADGKEVIYEAGFGDFDEGQQIEIFVKDDKLWAHHTGYILPVFGDGGEIDDLREIDYDEAVAIVEEWKEHYEEAND